MKTIIDEHDPFRVILVLAIQIAALCLDVVCSNLPCEESVGTGAAHRQELDSVKSFIVLLHSFAWHRAHAGPPSLACRQ